MRFSELGLSQDVLQALEQMGFEEPSPVQCEAIPLLMQGRDLTTQALTGTGKTAAFGIPIVERLTRRQTAPQAIVLAPTRELALQVAGEVHRIGKLRQVRVLPIYGGQPYDRQLRALERGVDVVVATPGRLLDHLRQGKIDLSQIRILVLDEADEMLNMGFLEDVEQIMSSLPAERQTALFSATMPAPIVQLSQRYMRDPVAVRLSQPRAMTVASVEQSYYVVPFRHKFDALTRLIDLKRPERSMVFAATKRMVDELTEALQANGLAAEALHGDLSQAQRERVMRAFREGRIELLVATDVAARGIDVEKVTHVFNFDLPNDPEYYVHRIGRTGRAGRGGEAISLVNPWEQRELKVIEQATGARITKAEVPTVAEVEEREREAVVERVARCLQEGRWGPYRALVEELAAEHDPVEIAAAALTLLGQRQRRAQRRSEAQLLSAEVAAGAQAARRAERRQRRATRPGETPGKPRQRPSTRRPRSRKR